MRNQCNFGICLVLLTWSTFAFAEISCPPMPAAITQVNRDVVSDIKAGVGKLGRFKGGELEVRTEVAAKNLFAKYPNVDQLLTLQTLSATYCSMLNSSDISTAQKLDRWEKFQDKVLKIGTQSSSEKKPTKAHNQMKKVDEPQASQMSINEKLLVDDNPTVVEPSEVTLTTWAGDSEPYLTVNFTNSSKRSARNFRASLVLGKSTVKFTPSRTSTFFQRSDIEIKPGKSLNLPLAPLREITNILMQERQLQSIAGVYLKEEDILKSDINCSNCNSIPALLEYSYNSIFDEKIIKYFSIFIVARNG